MLHIERWIWTLFLILVGCYKPWTPSEGTGSSYGHGGSGPDLVLPFPSGEYWLVTQTFGDGNIHGSHEDYGFRYGDDSFAIDFAQNGCEPYGKPITPMADGTVLRVEYDDDDRKGYGNSILIDHGDSYVSRYAHLSEIYVDSGDIVDEDDEIGEVGNSGYVSGSACPDHPGAHLHIALYEDGDAVAPFPMSGNDLQLSCWYNREGDEDCGGGHDDYDPVDDDDSSYTDIRMLEISPSWGVEEETTFIWTTVVDSEDEPQATLYIYNPREDHSYPFEMDSWSEQSPWIFTYEKTLIDPLHYEYWVEVNGQIESEHDFIDVEEEDGFSIWRQSCDASDYEIDQNEEVTWWSHYRSDWDLDIDLIIVNPNDAKLYRFPMEVDDSGVDYYGRYSQEMRDVTTYVWWTVGDNGRHVATTPVERLTVEN